MPVYKDEKKGTWTVLFEYKDCFGQRKGVTKRGFATKREATQWEIERKIQLSGSMEMTLVDFVKLYRENRFARLRVSTIEKKDNIIDTKILPFLGAKKLVDITPKDIIQWQNVLIDSQNPRTQKPYSKSYLKEIHAQLSAILNYAVKYYGLKENSAKTAGNMGSEKEIKLRFWTKDQYLAFSEAMMDDPLAYYCFEVLYWTGMRVGEFLALTREDVNLTAKTITISKTFQHIKGKDIVGEPKTPKSNRTVILPDFLCAELEDYFRMYYDLHPTDRLFPVSKSFLYLKLKTGSAKLGLPRIRVHDLRHSHVSLLINMGFDAVAIAERMGHESIHITYRYAHLFPNVQSQMGEKLNDLREASDHV